MKRLNRLPLPLRLALGYSLFFAAVLFLIVAGVYWLVRNALIDEVSQELVAASELIQNDFSASEAPLLGYFSDSTAALRALPPRVEGLDAPTLYVQISDPDGTTVVTSASLAGQALPLGAAASQAALAGRESSSIVKLGQSRVLQHVAPLYSQSQVVGVMQVAQPLRAVEQTLRVLVYALGVTALITVLTAVRGGIWIARRALRPVEEIALTARQIVNDLNLHRRVPEPPSSDELGELAATVNQMLQRLEQLFTAQRRFVADVGHELRTPLTAMRVHLELIQRGVPGDGPVQSETLTDMLREVDRLSRMANDVLLLAQAEVGLELRHDSVALDELVLEVVRELHPLAGGAVLRPRLSAQLTVIGDRDRLKQALLNLVANALQYATAGALVTVALEQHAGQAWLRVCDTGPGIAPEHLAHVFERFYRADRALRPGGTGLGLSIVQWVAEAHGGQAMVESQLGRGTTFTIALPLAAPTS